MRLKKAVGVAARFTTYEAKYDGLPDSDLQSVKPAMTNAIADFELTNNEARKYIHNCFSGNAKSFFDNDDRFNSALTVNVVFDLMSSRFMPPASRAAVSNILDTLSIAKPL